MAERAVVALARVPHQRGILALVLPFVGPCLPFNGPCPPGDAYTALRTPVAS